MYIFQESHKRDTMLLCLLVLLGPRTVVAQDEEVNNTMGGCSHAPPAHSIEYGTVTISGNNHGDTLTIKCYNDFTLTGPAIFVCDGESGQWISLHGLVRTTDKGEWGYFNKPYCKPNTIADYCKVMPLYDHVHIEYDKPLAVGFVPKGGKARYWCEGNYTMIASKYELTCTNGDWDGPDPHCVTMYKCSGAPYVEGGLAFVNGDSYGSSIKFRCEPGRELLGNYLLICLNDGDWWIDDTGWGTRNRTWVTDVKAWNTPKQPICSDYTRDQYCSPFPPIDRLTVEYSFIFEQRIVPGSLVRFSCEDNYTLTDGYHMEPIVDVQTCLNLGEWDGLLPKCVAADQEVIDLEGLARNGKVAADIMLDAQEDGDAMSLHDAFSTALIATMTTMMVIGVLF